MLENRSFDHYFGNYPGVRGFDDHPKNSLGAFSQQFSDNHTSPPIGRLLPFRLDAANAGSTQCTTDLTHEWGAQHQAWNHGRMDRFVDVHTSSDEGIGHGVLTMGYYTRSDLPYYYALADAFTIGDAYHCSVLGPTDPNRMMQMSGTIDPAGKAGGPILFTDSKTSALWDCHWDTMPEILQDHGISWKYYRPGGSLYNPSSMETVGITYDTVLPRFSQYRNPSSPLNRNGLQQTYPDDFLTDLRTGKLPKVSWISTPAGYDEHPPAPPSYGMHFTDQLLRTLTAVPEVWSRTVLFLMYDENDGFFDHVAPPVAPKGTAGEYLTVRPLPPAAEGVDGPIGLGVRVPLLVISPFSRGGYVCSQVFDHTSQLRFLEERFGVKAPGISEWRRRTVGDLTATLHLGHADTSKATLPATSNAVPAGCTGENLLGVDDVKPRAAVPDPQSMPTQEPGRARRLGNATVA